MVLLNVLTPHAARACFLPAASAISSRARRKGTYSPVTTPRQPSSTRVRAGGEASSSDAAEDILRATEELLAQIGSTKATQAEEHPSYPEESGDGLVLHCDVSGCSIIPVAKGQPSPTAGPLGTLMAAKNMAASNGAEVPKDFQLAEGLGWKIGLDHGSADPTAFCAVLGGDGWSIALTRAEYNDFVKSLRNLRRSIATLDICGEWGTGRAESDEATLEVSTERVWMQGRAPQKRLSALQELWTRGVPSRSNGQPDVAFDLRFILTTPGGRELDCLGGVATWLLCTPALVDAAVGPC
ncbi:hypothetical protein WJX72_004934 [[Myrmecia] bisecta]|uniref:Uncharacterized protein n=1 Tax=[Myrmecia] bisecta TaxID=41462 RepID=A0AAW1R6Y7_9CHLO